MNSSRSELRDNLSFVLILAIAVGHFIGNYTDHSQFYRALFLFIYSWHMPLLIFLTGRFHTDEDIPQKIAACLGFYVLLKVIVFAIETVFGLDPGFKLLKEDNFIWIFLGMAGYILISRLLRGQNLLLVLVFSLMIGCFIGYDTSIGDTLVLSRLLVFYPFYVAGMITADRSPDALRSRTWLRAAAAAILFFWLALCFLKCKNLYFLRSLFTGRNAFKEEILPWGCFYRLGCYLISSAAILCLILIVPGRKIPVLTATGREALPIYCWHRIILYLLSNLGILDFFCTRRMIGLLAWIGVSVVVLFLTSLPVFTVPVHWFARLPWKAAPGTSGSSD